MPDRALDVAETVDALVFDTSVRGKSGGTGRTFPWRAAKPWFEEAKTRTPVVLAGGLNPSNVDEAIRTLAPSVVDVSSGVEESPGIKSPNLMQAFADAVVSASIV